MDQAKRRVGISAIAVYEPQWKLDNEWFAEGIARKFVHHTGIRSRCISQEGEVAMAVRAVEALEAQTGCDLTRCCGLVFVSPSLVRSRHGEPGTPLRVRDRVRRAAGELARRLALPPASATGINWGCSGYSRALSRVDRLMAAGNGEEFLLVVTVSRISRITDYESTQTAPLFGDLATATLVCDVRNTTHPVHFEIAFAEAERQPTAGVLFDYRLRENVLTPTPGGSQRRASRRLVFWLDGMGIGEAASRAMGEAAAKALCSAGVRAEDVRFVVPHQAGTGIVKLAAMKLEEAGIHGELINGLTRDVGNVSSCSVPYALHQTWDRLDGTILCPTAGVGKPGDPHVARGCIVLRATRFHRQCPRVPAEPLPAHAKPVG